ncbi:hypothetical protein NW762_012502 [Fusarium torreyae]|uniref:Uncharacterized protein n=1 Tax=Fusarium torreyae TaxID=1237075 RepID=A0A9W8V8T4_9HYPO|nr:hypothetical protein NW762_012502 [Fusarium torreyae]
MAHIESHTPVRASDRLLPVPGTSHTSSFDNLSDNISLKTLPAISSSSTENLINSASKSRRFVVPYRNKLQILSVAVHVLAVAMTIVIVQLSLREIYWFDQTAKMEVFGHEVKAESNKHALQFVAKIHEALIVASLTAITFHIMRLMLRGQGISFGVLDGAYRFGSVPWLWSKGLWGALQKPSHNQNFLFAIGLALAAIYANIVGPSSAILLLPRLDWWKVHDSFNGRNLTTFILGSRSEVFPTHLELKGTRCKKKPTGEGCPGEGYSDILALLESYKLSEIDLETQVKLPVSESYRRLSSTLQFNEYIPKNDHVAVASTSHTSIATLAGLLWNHIQAYPVGTVNHIKRPQFRPKTQDIRAPLVQVQCSPFSWLNATKGPDHLYNPVFKTNQLRNFSQLPDGEDTSNYQRLGSEVAREELWNHTKSTFHIPTFHWFDPEPLYNNSALSLAAVATVPAYYYRNGKAQQDSIILPCMIDARWVDVSLKYDPTVENSIQSNFTDLSWLSHFWHPKEKSSTPRGLTSPNVKIDTNWAQLLSYNTEWHYKIKSRKRPVTTVENLLDVFIQSFDQNDKDSPAHFVPPYNTGTGRQLANFENETSAVEPYINKISKTVAATISLVVVDGMSRVVQSRKMHLMTKNFFNGSVQGTEHFHDQHADEDDKPGMEMFEVTDLDERVALDWEVRRYGWGYGRQNATVYFAITVLFIHVGLVLAFGIYMAIFWVRGERPGKSRDTVSEFVALALTSPPTGDNVSEVRRIADGEEEEKGGSKLLTLPIKLRVDDENQRVLSI